MGIDLGQEFVKRWKKIKAENPDYIGSWEPFVADQFGYGIFAVFIKEKKDSKIKGTIKDCLGKSTFEGNLTEQEISFKKRYSPQAIKKGGYDGEIIYKGMKFSNELYENCPKLKRSLRKNFFQPKEDFYIGQFEWVGGKSDGYKSDFWMKKIQG